MAESAARTEDDGGSAMTRVAGHRRTSNRVPPPVADQDTGSRHGRSLLRGPPLNALSCSVVPPRVPLNAPAEVEAGGKAGRNEVVLRPTNERKLQLVQGKFWVQKKVATDGSSPRGLRTNSLRYNGTDLSYTDTLIK